MRRLASRDAIRRWAIGHGWHARTPADDVLKLDRGARWMSVWFDAAGNVNEVSYGLDGASGFVPLWGMGMRDPGKPGRIFDELAAPGGTTWQGPEADARAAERYASDRRDA